METPHDNVIRPNTILLATDGSKDAELAARAATDLARRTGAELHVAHAWHQDEQGFGYPTGVWTDYSYLFEREARRRLARQVDAIEASGGAVAQQHLVHGSTIDVLLDLCEELQPGLLIMGSRGLGPVGRAGLGSVSEGVVHHARIPVLVLRGAEAAWPPERVAVGEDGSEGARRAAEIALGIAALFGADGLLVRAYRNPPEPTGGWSAEDRRRFDQAKSEVKEDLNKRADALVGAAGGRPGTRVVHAEGTPALLRVAGEGEETKTLIAVGSRGLGAAGRARLGSVSTNVIRAARGPVLIYPHLVHDVTASASQEEATAAAVPPPGSVAPERVIS